MGDVYRDLKETAEELYEKVDFRTSALFNEPAPEYRISFGIGAAFSVVGIPYFFYRLHNIKKSVDGRQMSANLLVRAIISALIDNDDPAYTIIKFSAQSFLFLGGLQLNYEVTFAAILGFFALEAFLDALRIFLAFSGYNSISELVVTTRHLRDVKRGMTKLSPTNVYEDITRRTSIVVMVFITQVILISFVIVDIFDSSTHSCRDGSQSCPVVGTFGSWGFYVLGIFMACVFLLGPKTKFGQSEQNPAYWLQLLLSAKHSGSKVTWNDPVQDKNKQRDLRPDDIRIWLRFIMSFLINGVGFHILVHALPVQVASQSSFTGVVFRAVGMMYLVDLDDTPGYTLTIVESAEVTVNENGTVVVQEEAPSNDNPNVIIAPDSTDGIIEAEMFVPNAAAANSLIAVKPPAKSEELVKEPSIKKMSTFESVPPEPTAETPVDVSAEVERILEEAQEKLNKLAGIHGLPAQVMSPASPETGNMALAAGAMAMSLAAGISDGEVTLNDDDGTDKPDADSTVADKSVEVDEEAGMKKAESTQFENDEQQVDA